MCNIFGYIYVYISTYTTQKDPQQKNTLSFAAERCKWMASDDESDRKKTRSFPAP